MSEEYSTTLRRDNERLQAELAEWEERNKTGWIQELRDHAKLSIVHKQQATALALRVKRLEDALGSIREYWNRDQNESAMSDACWYAINTAEEALSDSDKTAEEVIAEWLGEPVGEVKHMHELNDEWLANLPIGTKIYAPRTEVTK